MFPRKRTGNAVNNNRFLFLIPKRKETGNAKKSKMNNYQYILEPSPVLNLDRNRKRVSKCPCGKDNKDGKFIPGKSFTDRGYCHSCGLWYSIGNHTCPGCKKVHSFNKYIDKSSGEVLSNEAGKCIFCNYHYTPKQFFEDTADLDKKPKKTIEKVKKERFPFPYTKEGETGNAKKPSFLPFDIMDKSITCFEKNSFLIWIKKLFGESITEHLAINFLIGTSKHWKGACVFWYVDVSGKIRSGKIMLYDYKTGKRVKTPFNHITWVHSALKLEGFEFQSCFFGEYQLALNPDKPVCIVESEKTAVVCSVYFPKYLWLATGGAHGAKWTNAETCKVLKGKKVLLVPDIDKHDLWKEKAEILKRNAQCNVRVLDILANKEQDKKDQDIADYLLARQDSTGLALTENEYPVMWDYKNN